MGLTVTSGADGVSETPDTIDTRDMPDTSDSHEIPDTPDTTETPGAPVEARTIYRVIARDGLLVRGGPATDFPALKSLPYGTQVNVLKREGQWALVDQLGDSAADGFVLSTFLDGGTTLSPLQTADAISEGDRFVVIKAPLLQFIMDRCANTKIKSKLDLELVSDALTRSMIKADANNRKREVGFLSQAVVETDYFRTFKEYGEGAGKEYYPFYGRGIHQLTHVKRMPHAAARYSRMIVYCEIRILS